MIPMSVSLCLLQYLQPFPTYCCSLKTHWSLWKALIDFSGTLLLWFCSHWFSMRIWLCSILWRKNKATNVALQLTLSFSNFLTKPFQAWLGDLIMNVMNQESTGPKDCNKRHNYSNYIFKTPVLFIVLPLHCLVWYRDNYFRTLSSRLKQAQYLWIEFRIECVCMYGQKIILLLGLLRWVKLRTCLQACALNLPPWSGCTHNPNKV